jgi:hypothetical protein
MYHKTYNIYNLLKKEKMNTKLVLITNPKNHKERENNKEYYRQKFFSKSQLKKVEDDKRKLEIAVKQIDQRSNGGGCNALTASCYNCPDYTNSNKKRNALIDQGDKYAILLNNCPTMWKEITKIKKTEQEQLRKQKQMNNKNKHFDNEDEEDEDENEKNNNTYEEEEPVQNDDENMKYFTSSVEVEEEEEEKQPLVKIVLEEVDDWENLA